MNEPAIILYTRIGCRLCDEAHQVLAKFGLVPELVGIDTNPTLLERYNDCVPVVFIDGKERFRGRVDERLLRRLLSRRQQPPRGTL